MKLTLAMGLQYDNGKETSMVALSLGKDKSLPMRSPDSALKAAVTVDAVQLKAVEAGALSVVEPVKKNNMSFFLTYN